MQGKGRGVEREPQGSPLDAVLGCIARGWDVIPIPSGSKKPGKGWNERAPITEATAPHYFNGRPQNIGVRLGQRSGGLTDVDLDALEAVELAPYFLPPTHAVFGRPSKPRSHYLYTVANFQGRPYKLPGTNGEMIVEARADNCQTVIPPGIHTSGEEIKWHEQGEPGTPSAEDLERAVLHLAVAALLLRHYPGKDGGRHNYTLPLTGVLLRDGQWTEDEVRHLVEVVGTAAEDEELDDRLKNVRSSTCRCTRSETVPQYASRASANSPSVPLRPIAARTERKRLTVFAGSLGAFWSLACFARASANSCIASRQRCPTSDSALAASLPQSICSASRHLP